MATFVQAQICTFPIGPTRTALRFPREGLNVQANMIQSRNGHSHSERRQSNPKGRFIGEQLKLPRRETYRQAVELLAEPRPASSLRSYLVA